MQMRVEEFAVSADVSVDTIRFYQKQGLLPPPERAGRVAWYGEAHRERMVRIRDLQHRGFSLAVIRRFLAGELDPADEGLAAAVVEAGVGADRAGDEELLDLEEFATRTSVPAPLLEALVREGLLVPRPHRDGPRFTAADVATVGAGLRLVEAGLPLPELFELARRHHTLTREVATHAVELFDTHIRKPLRESDLPEADKADRLVEAFRILMPEVTALVANHFRRILLEVAQEHLEAVGEPGEIAAAEVEARRPLEAAAGSGP